MLITTGEHSPSFWNTAHNERLVLLLWRIAVSRVEQQKRNAWAGEARHHQWDFAVAQGLGSLEQEAIFQRVLLFDSEGGCTGVEGFSWDFHDDSIVVPKLGFLQRDWDQDRGDMRFSALPTPPNASATRHFGRDTPHRALCPAQAHPKPCSSPFTTSPHLHGCCPCPELTSPHTTTDSEEADKLVATCTQGPRAPWGMSLCPTLARWPRESCVQLWSPQHRTDLDLLELGQRRPQQWSKGWSTSAVRKGWESWGCSAQRREGSGETLEKPASAWRGLRESWRGAFHKGMAWQDKR